MASAELIELYQRLHENNELSRFELPPSSAYAVILTLAGLNYRGYVGGLRSLDESAWLVMTVYCPDSDTYYTIVKKLGDWVDVRRKISEEDEEEVDIEEWIEKWLGAPLPCHLITWEEYFEDDDP